MQQDTGSSTATRSPGRAGIAGTKTTTTTKQRNYLNVLAFWTLAFFSMSYKHLLFVILLQVVAAVQKAMASHHPLLLHQTLKASETSVMRVQHELHQRRHHAAQVSVFLLCAGGTERRRSGIHEGEFVCFQFKLENNMVVSITLKNHRDVPSIQVVDHFSRVFQKSP